MRRVFVAMAAGAVALAAAVPAFGQNKDDKPVKVTVKAAKLDDLKAALAANKGHATVIDFWATWCEPCKEMFPHLVAAHNKRSADGLRVLAVSVDSADKTAAVEAFAAKCGAKFPVVRFEMGDDDWDTAATKLNKELFPGVKFEGAVPLTLIYGRDGKLVKAFTEKAPEKELDEAIEKALAEKK
jgi:thiol-disulfide isomerase/thioredoxin